MTNERSEKTTCIILCGLNSLNKHLLQKQTCLKYKKILVLIQKITLNVKNTKLSNIYIKKLKIEGNKCKYQTMTMHWLKWNTLKNASIHLKLHFDNEGNYKTIDITLIKS